MSIKNEKQYRDIVKGLAADIVAIALGEGLDTFGYDSEEKTIDTQALLDFIQDEGLIHEQVDSSEYTIYTCHHLDILKYSDNDDALIYELGSDFISDCTSFIDVASRFAYWALYSDVRDELCSNIDEYVEL